MLAFFCILLGCLASESEWKKSNEAPPMGEEGDTTDNRYPGRASQLLIVFYVLTVHVHMGIHSFYYYLHQESANLFCKKPTVNISGFAGHRVSVITTHLCSAAVAQTQHRQYINKCGCVPKKR